MSSTHVPSDTTMTRFDDDPMNDTCAWGRWHMGPARNETMPVRERGPEHAAKPAAVHRIPRVTPPVRLRRSRARLLLVSDNGARRRPPEPAR